MGETADLNQLKLLIPCRSVNDDKRVLFVVKNRTRNKNSIFAYLRGHLKSLVGHIL